MAYRRTGLLSALKMGDLECARNERVAIDGRNRTGYEETAVMRYDLKRVGNGKHARALGGTIFEGEKSCVSLGGTSMAAEDTLRLVYIGRVWRSGFA